MVAMIPLVQTNASEHLGPVLLFGVSGHHHVVHRLIFPLGMLLYELGVLVLGVILELGVEKKSAS